MVRLAPPDFNLMSIAGTPKRWGRQILGECLIGLLFPWETRKNRGRGRKVTGLGEEKIWECREILAVLGKQGRFKG
jgi:hypothetical protein